MLSKSNLIHLYDADKNNFCIIKQKNNFVHFSQISQRNNFSKSILINLKLAF